MRNIIGRPVQGDDFFRHTKLIKKIWRTIANGNNILLNAPEKTGQSSLLLHLRDNAPADATIIYIDDRYYSDADDFFTRCYRAIVKSPLGSDKLEEIVSGDDDSEYCHQLRLHRVLAALESDVKLIMMIDNFSYVLDQLLSFGKKEEAQRIIGVMLAIRRDVTLHAVQFIFSGAKDLKGLAQDPDVHAAVSDLVAIDLSPLPNKEAQAFILSLATNAGLTIVPDAADAIINKLVYLIPYHLQLIFQQISHIAIDEDLDHITSELVEAAFLNLVENKPLFEPWPLAITKCFAAAEYDFAKLLLDTLANRRDLNLDQIIDLAAKNDLEKGYQDIVKNLISQGYLHRINKELYCFHSGLIKAWWREHASAAIHQRPTKELKSVEIRTLKIHNVKCIEDIEINFHSSDKTSLILGTNARGKTTILQLLALGLSAVNNVPFVYSWKDVVKKGSASGEFELDLLVAGQPLRLCFDIDAEDNISCTAGADQLKNLQDKFLMLAYGANRHIKLEDPRPNKALEAIATLFGENGYLKHIKASANYEYVDKHFVTIAPLINKVLEMADVENKVGLVDYDSTTLYFNTPSSARVAIEALSEGFKSTFVWLFDMIIRIVEKGGDLHHANEITGVVLLDEVDLHLHPSWQRTIVPSLNRLFPGIQFIVTSHSPFVAQSIKSDHVISLEWVDDKVIVVQKDLSSQMSYAAVAREVFDIESPFSDEMTQTINRFRAIQNAIRLDKNYDEAEFKSLINEIAAQGVELEGMMRREVQRLERQIGKEFNLWTS